MLYRSQRKQCIFAVYACSFPQSNMNVGFYSHHITENHFSKVTSKIPIAISEGVLIMADLSTISDTGDFPLCETPFCWSLWHFTLLINFKVFDCSFSVSLMVSFSTTSFPLNATVPLEWVPHPPFLWYSILFGCSHPLSWSLPSPTGWWFPNL